jgi:transposase InsO family protein
MSRENALWGAPRIHCELLKLGIEISQATVSNYIVRNLRPPSQTWRTFLANHADGFAPIDLFVVPTVTFRLLYAFIVLRHKRRRVFHFDVTSHPTTAWLGQKLVEAFPWETAPRYLIRDRDAAYGTIFRDRLETMSIVEVPTAPRSPWQNAYVERVIGSIRRECLDHVIVLNARHLQRIRSSYFDYYHRSRTHLSLAKDRPDPRPAYPPGAGKIVAFPRVSDLHHRYEKLAA